jgi:hypothetical protein
MAFRWAAIQQTAGLLSPHHRSLSTITAPIESGWRIQSACWIDWGGRIRQAADGGRCGPFPASRGSYHQFCPWSNICVSVSAAGYQHSANLPPQGTRPSGRCVRPKMHFMLKSHGAPSPFTVITIVHFGDRVLRRRLLLFMPRLRVP